MTRSRSPELAPLPLFDLPHSKEKDPISPPLGFGGETFDPKLDGKRLGRQMRRVYDLMTDGSGRWWTLRDLEDELGHPQASLSARLRDLRKMGFDVERRRRGEGSEGVWEYRCITAS